MPEDARGAVATAEIRTEVAGEIPVTVAPTPELDALFDPRLHAEPGPPFVRTDHRGRQGRLRAKLHAARRPRDSRPNPTIVRPRMRRYRQHPSGVNTPDHTPSGQHRERALRAPDSENRPLIATGNQCAISLPRARSQISARRFRRARHTVSAIGLGLWKPPEVSTGHVKTLVSLVRGRDAPVLVLRAVTRFREV